MTKYSFQENWTQLDRRVRREDEDRWLSSRYAPRAERERLVALYALNLELAKVRLVVTEPGLAAIRFQWWREVAGEFTEGRPPREHDIVRALYAADLSPKTIEGLIDGHQAAFDASDRALEPDAFLMRAAAGVLAPAHGWGPHIAPLASLAAAARRGQEGLSSLVVPPVPQLIRPAIAHAALRFAYLDGEKPGPIKKRLVVMRAIMNGIV